MKEGKSETYTVDTSAGTIEEGEVELPEPTPDERKEYELNGKSQELEQEINALESQEDPDKKSIFEIMKQKYEDYKDTKRQEKFSKQRLKSEYDEQIKEIRKRQSLSDYEFRLQEKMRIEGLPGEQRREAKKQAFTEKVEKFGKVLGTGSMPNFREKAAMMAGIDTGNGNKLRGMIGRPTGKGFGLGGGKIPDKTKLMGYTGGGPNYGGKVRGLVSTGKGLNYGGKVRGLVSTGKGSNYGKRISELTGGNNFHSNVGKGFDKNKLAQLTGTKTKLKSNVLKSELKGTPKGFTSKDLFSSGGFDKKLGNALGGKKNDKKLKSLLGR